MIDFIIIYQEEAQNQLNAILGEERKYFRVLNEFQRELVKNQELQDIFDSKNQQEDEYYDEE